MNNFILDFEKPVSELEEQIKELQEISSVRTDIDIGKEVKNLQTKLDSLIGEIYGNLDSWERVQLCRHPNRPHALDYIHSIITDFHLLHGDRKFADDKTMITGLGYLEGKKVAVIGIEKGENTKDKIHYNFGMSSPEGYRKALRLMKLADRFKLPIITFIDTPGAYPGLGAEERGQAEAIADNLVEMFELGVPVISVVIGEGGSGGALGIALGNKVFMMEYSIYSVISPESCASILWSDPSKASQAANALKLDAVKAKELGVIDALINEPAGGAHRNPESAIASVKNVLIESINELANLNDIELKQQRYEKYRKMGNQSLRNLE